MSPRAAVRALLVLAAAGAAAAFLLVPASQPGPVAFENVTVVPMDRERVLPGQTVVVRDGRIVDIGPAASVGVPGDARRVDGTARYLMPGLTDAHFHLQGNEADDRRLLEVLVANGVTSILNLCGTPSILGLRDRVARGTCWGRRSTRAGPTSPTPRAGSRRRTRWSGWWSSRSARGTT